MIFPPNPLFSGSPLTGLFDSMPRKEGTLQAEFFLPLLVLRETLATEKPPLATFETSWPVFHKVVVQHNEGALNFLWLTSGAKAK